MSEPDLLHPASDEPPAASVFIDDCWNKIGVTGDQSCPKLATYIHCRNCDVYAAAAQRNLQRAVGGDYQEQWASHFRRQETSTLASDSSALVFRIGLEWLSLPTRLFVTVAPQAKPHVLPHRSGRGLLGVVNVGGKLYPCMSLAALLDIDDSAAPPARDRHTFARLLVLQWEDQAFALPVADLHGIVRYAGASVRAPAATINKGLSRFLSGVLELALPQKAGMPATTMQVGCLDAALVGYQLARTLR